MSQQRRRHLRNTPAPGLPETFVRIDRPADRSLRGAVVAFVAFSALAAPVLPALVTLLVAPDGTIFWAGAAAAGAALGAGAAVSSLRRSGRRRREDFVRCGGDLTGVSNLMFGIMRGRRTAGGTWEVPRQGSGDYT